MKRMPKKEKGFIEFFKEKWLRVVERQIEASCKSNNRSSYIDCDKWKIANDFMNNFAQENENNFEFLFQSDKSNDKLFVMRIIHEIDQYLNNNGFEKIKNSQHYGTKKSEFIRDLEPIKKNIKNTIKLLKNNLEKYPIISSTPSFNHLILPEIFKILKNKKYPDFFQNIEMDRILASLYQNSLGLVPFVDILEVYLDVLEKDLKSETLNEPYNEFPRLNRGNDSIIKLQILFNKLAEEVQNFTNYRECLGKIENIVKSLDKDCICDNIDFCENYKRQEGRNKKKFPKNKKYIDQKIVVIPASFTKNQ